MTAIKYFSQAPNLVLCRTTSGFKFYFLYMNTHSSDSYRIIHLFPTDLCFALLCAWPILIGWLLALYMENGRDRFKPRVLLSSSGDFRSLWVAAGAFRNGSSHSALRDRASELGTCPWGVWERDPCLLILMSLC